MKEPDQIEHLLDDVLEEAVPPALRETSLERTLGAVRRRQRVRRAQRGVLAAGMVCGLVLAAWWSLSGGNRQPANSAFQFVITQPLAPVALVETQPGASRLITTAAGQLVQIATQADQELIREFSDEELLAILNGKAAALVRETPHQAQLVFLNPADAEGFPVR